MATTLLPNLIIVNAAILQIKYNSPKRTDDLNRRFRRTREYIYRAVTDWFINNIDK